MNTTKSGSLLDHRVDNQHNNSERRNYLQSPPWGTFRFFFDEDRWDWSPTVEQMHGYRPGTTAPDTAVLLNHVHPDDRGHVMSLLDQVRRTRRPFSTRHRLVDTHAQVHDVVVIGAPIYPGDDRGAIGMQCSCVDLTAATAPAEAERFDRAAEHLRIIADHGYTDDDRRRRIRAATRC